MNFLLDRIYEDFYGRFGFYFQCDVYMKIEENEKNIEFLHA
jgi:hypothetical protein